MTPPWVTLARASGAILARLDRPGVKPWSLFAASVDARRLARLAWERR